MDATVTTTQACNDAIAAGYTTIVTFAGEMPLTEWRDRIHSMKDLNYQNGRLYSAWGKSIIEPGKLERLAFELR